jgi:DNA polymerase-3 subunit delta
VSLSIEQIETAFKSGKPEPVYFLFGDETFLLDQVEEAAQRWLVPPAEQDFNHDVLYGAELDAASALGLCRSYPMMGTRRVVVVRDFDKVRGNAIFTQLAESPNPACVVLLVCRGKPRLNAHPYRALKQKCAWAEFKEMKPHAVAGWIGQHARSRGYQMASGADAMLAEMVGTSLSRAASECDKLFTLAGERREVTCDDVLYAAGQSAEANVFALQEHVAKGCLSDALTVLDRLLQQSSQPQSEAHRIVSLLGAYFQKLLRLSRCQLQSVPQNQMAKVAGVPPFFLSEYLSVLRGFRPARLQQAFGYLLAADYELKGGASREASLVLTLLMHRLSALPQHRGR